MKERPILFSGPMVRALLDGTKTQTRRVIKPQPDGALDYHRGAPREFYETGGGWFVARDENHKPTTVFPVGKDSCTSDILCPYGAPRDRLYVRETWGIYDGEGMPYTYPDGIPKQRPNGFHVSYPADDESGTIGKVFKWRPAIHMPRWASRITLEVESVRVERLQDISEEDAWAEGCKRGLAADNGGFFPAEEPDPSGKGLRGWDNAREWYADLWESINGRGSWDANPWVWVVTFKVLRP